VAIHLLGRSPEAGYRITEEPQGKRGTSSSCTSGGNYRGLMRSLWERFLEAFGSPNYIDNQFHWEGAPAEGLFLTQGHYSPRSMTLKTLVSSSPSAQDSSNLTGRPCKPECLWLLPEGKPEQRGKLIEIEPRLSVTAMKADEWIPAPPGTEGLIALGIASMIIKEGLYNKEFIANRAFGFENWTDASGRERVGFKEFVLSTYGADIVSKRTGIPIDTFIRLAREFASNQPSLAIGFRDRPFQQMAVSVLNGLVGNIDNPGGVLIRGPFLSETSLLSGRIESPKKGCWPKGSTGGKSPIDASSAKSLCQKCDLRKTLPSESALPLLYEPSLFKSQPGTLQKGLCRNSSDRELLSLHG